MSSTLEDLKTVRKRLVSYSIGSFDAGDDIKILDAIIANIELGQRVGTMPEPTDTERYLLLQVCRDGEDIKSVSNRLDKLEAGPVECKSSAALAARVHLLEQRMKNHRHYITGAHSEPPGDKYLW